MNDYVFYGLDCETTGLDFVKNDVIELCIYRMSDESKRTWKIKPIDYESIQLDALRINGHKMDDLKHLTKYGRENYKEPSKVLVEIENWLAEDERPSTDRFMIGHNVSFDKVMLEYLWGKQGASESFPFGRRFMDTMIIELFLDYCGGEFASGYSQANLSKKYGVKNEKAHTAEADTVTMMGIFKKQVEAFKKALAKNV